MTRTQFDGALGGLDGADALCQAHADDAGLVGTYFAWLSTSNDDDPESRFTRSVLPYVRADDVSLADNWDDFVDGELAAMKCGQSPDSPLARPKP